VRRLFLEVEIWNFSGPWSLVLGVFLRRVKRGKKIKPPSTKFLSA
jgi:hypothetical protein